jgi:acetoin utilization deacetylase AcuC-like enzyme
MSNKRKVAYFYDESIANFYYGHDHPMKPKRIAMTHSLINHYKLYSLLHVYEPQPASKDDLTMFHTPEYVDYLEKVSSKNMARLFEKKNPFKIGETSDCPIFNGVYNFCQSYAGGSLDSAQLINDGQQSICLNWAGGLHHAKKSEASGFCYINDIVLCILELLRYHPRVLYIDIDVHHGDGVEEAFFCTNRVMTVSFHQYGKDFFPGTGHHDSIGEGEGKHYAVNVPLYPGTDDEMFVELFKDVMNQVLDKFRPDAIVMQCGADSLNEDRLGQFNLSTHGHGECVNYILKTGTPVILLGGGGYTIENVARCWTHETAIALDKVLDNKLPPNEYSSDYSTPNLHVESNKSMENKNPKEHIQKLKESIYERLKLIEGRPGIEFQEIPESLRFKDIDYDDKIHPENENYDTAPKDQNLTSKPENVTL